MRPGIPPKALKRRKLMTSELSQHDKDFANAMALKLHLNREKRAAEEKEQKLIEEAGDFRMSFVRSAIKKYPNLTIEQALKMMDERGF